ncbi:phist protein [Plasmodium cynomolgi strain B]|uniref:Phist protein n=1 Tax=Plasmodium cynomolgi (strain B) TaxID=1120755 RepID=K6VJG3_PLACD|nr:phist protein [Plasmodium cynomolgi strain B]GAB69537.1 phist protein [Plasmodium cynomolgi strain B]
MVYDSANASVLSKKSVVKKNQKSNRGSANMLECTEENSSKSNLRKFMFSKFAKVFLVGCLYMFLENGNIYEDTIVSERHWGNVNARRLAEANLRREQRGNDEYLGKDFDPYDMSNLPPPDYGTGNANDLIDFYQRGGDSANMWGAGGNRAIGFGEQNWDAYYKNSYGNFPPSPHNSQTAHRGNSLDNRMLRYGDSSLQKGMMGSMPSSLGNIPNESAFGSRASMGGNEADGAVGGRLPGSTNMNEGVFGSKGAVGGSQGEQMTDDKYAVFDSLYEEYLGSAKGGAGLAGVGAAGGSGLGATGGADSTTGVGATGGVGLGAGLGSGLGNGLGGGLGSGLGAGLDGGLGAGLGAGLDDGLGIGLGGGYDGSLDASLGGGLGGGLGGFFGADMGSRSDNIFNKPSDAYRQYEPAAPSDSMWSGLKNQYDSYTEPKMSTSASTTDIYPGEIWAEYKQQLENYSGTRDELDKIKSEKHSSERSSSSQHRKRSSSERTSSSSRSKSSSDNRIVKYSAKKGTTSEEYERRRKESKIQEQASSKHIKEMIDKLGSTVNMRDMFYIFNCLINHERRKYIDMEEGTMLFWEKTAKAYGLPDYYKTRQWVKAFDGMTKELFYNEKKLFDRLYHLLQHGSCSRSGYIQFIKEVKYTCTRMRKEMEDQWKEYLSMKVRGFW